MFIFLKFLNLAVTLAVVHWLYHLSLPLDFLGAAQAKVRSETHFSFPESFLFPLGYLFLLAPNQVCSANKKGVGTHPKNSHFKTALNPF